MDLPFSNSPVNGRPKSMLESGVGDALRASAAGNSFAGASLGAMNATGVNGVTCGSAFDARNYTAKANHQNYLHDITLTAPPPPVTESKIGRPETYGLARDFFKGSQYRSYSASAGRTAHLRYPGIDSASLTSKDLFLTRREIAEQSSRIDPSKCPGGERFKYGWQIGVPAKCGRGIDVEMYNTHPSALLRSDSYFDMHKRELKYPEPVTSLQCKCTDWERLACRTCGKAHADGAVGGCEYAKAVSDSYLTSGSDPMYAFSVHNPTSLYSHLTAAGARLRGAQNCQNNCPVCHFEHYQPSDLCKDYMARSEERVHNYMIRSLSRGQSINSSLHPDRRPCRVCNAHHIIYTPRDNPHSCTLPGSCKVCGSYHTPGHILERTCRTAGMDSISRLQTIARSGTMPSIDASTYGTPYKSLSGSTAGTSAFNKSGAIGSSMSMSTSSAISTAPGTRRFSLV